MKTCVIFGDLTSERSSENYPTVQVCNSCYAADTAKKEDAQIFTSQSYDPAYGDECAFCGVSSKDD